MAVETLSSSPSLAKVFVRAAVTSRGRGGDLPERALRLERVQVDRDHLLRYQRVCAFAVDDLLPHTYPHVLGFPLQAELMSRRDFPLPLPGLVHLENQITVRRTLTAGDALDVTVRAADLRPHPKGTLVDLLTEVDAAGERVWEGRSTYLRRGGGSVDAGTTEPAPVMPPGDPAALWRLPEELGRRYAAVSGDVNPIHLHALTARAMGFPHAIAHGMWTCARTLAALGRRSSAPSTSRVWFKKPVLLPSTVALVVDDSGEQLVAGLRSAKEPTTEHVVLTLG